MSTPDPNVAGYAVRYYDKKLSSLGRGVQTKHFHPEQLAEANAFAARHKLYARPCLVTTIYHQPQKVG